MKEEKKPAKLSRFEEAIKSMSAKEGETIISQTTAEAEKYIVETEKQLSEKSKAEIAAHKQKLSNSSEKSVSKAVFDAGKSVLVRRNELVDELFEDIRSKLTDFAAGDKYSAYLERCFAAAAEKIAFYDGVSVKYADKDAAAVGALAKRYGVKTEKSDDIKIGGVIFMYPNENKSIDITLDKSLDNEREAFVINSEMQM